MKNLLFFNKNMEIGGVEKVTLNIIKNLDEKKFKIKLILLEKDGELLNSIPSNIEVIGLLEKRKRNIKNPFLKLILLLIDIIIIRKKLKKLIKSEDIILNMNIRNIRLNFNFLKYKNKKIGWLHGNILNDFGTIIEKINYKFFKQYSIIYNVSKQGKEDFDKKFPYLINKSNFLYNSFDIDYIKSSANESLENNSYIISVGRLSYEKGFDILIEAIKLLKDDGIEEKLYIVGDGVEKEKLKKQIEILGLTNNVFLLGFIEEPYALMKNAKICILASRGEGLPSVLIEALACECPIISTDCKCGPREILKDGEYGALVPTENSYLLKEEIKKFLLDDQLCINLKKKSLERAHDFENKNILKKLEKSIIRI